MPNNDDDCMLADPRVCKLQRFMQTVCNVINSTETYKQMLREVHYLANSLGLDHACNNVNLRSSPCSSVFLLLMSNEDRQVP